MKILLILCSALVIQAAVIDKEKKCEGIIINDVYHDVEVLKTDIDRPFLLAVDNSRNTVYFSYSLNTNDDVFKSAYVNLNTKEFSDLDKVNNGFAQTVDQKTHDVYIGASDGIYKYQPKTKEVEFFAAKDSDIWSIYFKDGLYYSDFPSQFLFKLENRIAVRYKDLEDTKVDHFVIDNDDEFFFTNSTGLYSQKKGTKDAVLYQEFPNEGVRGITLDTEGKVYICVQDGIYRVEKKTTALEKVVDLDDGFGIAFDNENNIIYSDSTSLFRLKPNKDKTC